MSSSFNSVLGEISAIAGGLGAVVLPTMAITAWWNKRRKIALAAQIAEIVETSVQSRDGKFDALDTKVDMGFDALNAKFDAMQLSLARQFGGNGGGMREAINKQGNQIARIQGHLRIEDDQ